MEAAAPDGIGTIAEDPAPIYRGMPKKPIFEFVVLAAAQGCFF